MVWKEEAEAVHGKWEKGLRVTSLCVEIKEPRSVDDEAGLDHKKK